MRLPIFVWLSERWDEYQARKKSDALWNKLHRYEDSQGRPAKFKQKDAIAMGREALKQKRKKDG